MTAKWGAHGTCTVALPLCWQRLHTLCGLHAAPTLRRLLLEQDERGGS